MKREFLVIHSTGTPTGRPVTKADIHQWHIVERAWKRYGYPDLIDHEGKLIPLQNWDMDKTLDPWERTNGVYGKNDICHHIAVAGGLATYCPNFEQIQAISTYISFIALRWPDIKVVGHDYFNPKKACPNFTQVAWLLIKSNTKGNVNFIDY